MGRKIRKIIEEADQTKQVIDDAIAKLKELEDVAKLEQEVEVELFRTTFESIDAICKPHGIFCGAVYTMEDLFEMIRLLKNTGDNTVTVKYNLYFKDDINLTEDTIDNGTV
jgi:crotonobetainyl-CoA:carnitine CoA-transferase CaiB-like acyl-CoA transferase